MPKSFIESPFIIDPKNPLETVKMDEIIQTALRRHQVTVNRLTEEQCITVFKQALISGDFMRHVHVGTHAQGVTYVPYREMERLKSRISELERELEKYAEVQY